MVASMLMIVRMLVVVRMLMSMGMFVVMRVVMGMRMVMGTGMLVGVLMVMAVRRFGCMGISCASIKVFHIVVMVFMFRIQQHVKVTDIQAGFLHAADAHRKSVHRQRSERAFQRFPIRPQIQQGGRRHVAADACKTF